MRHDAMAGTHGQNGGSRRFGNKKCLATESVAKCGLADFETVHHQPPSMKCLCMRRRASAAEGEISPTPCPFVRPSTRLWLHSLVVHGPNISDIAVKERTNGGGEKNPRPLFSDAPALRNFAVYTLCKLRENHILRPWTLCLQESCQHTQIAQVLNTLTRKMLKIHDLPHQERKMSINAAPNSCNHDHTSTSKMIRRRIRYSDRCYKMLSVGSRVIKNHSSAARICAGRATPHGFAQSESD